MGINELEFFGGNIGDSINKSIELFRTEEVARRILEKDFTLWSDGPEEVEDRLGWLSAGEIEDRELESYIVFREELRKDKIDRVLLLGMGGSSLAPELFAKVFPQSGGLLLSVLDSVVPASILAMEKKHDPARTLYIVSSKSGTTVEVDALMKYFYDKACERLGAQEAGKHFIAITNPGTALVEIARKREFRRVFFYRPDIGGRYAALSPVGLIPAALIGMDLTRLLNSAAREVENSRGGELSPGAHLGAALGTCAMNGRNKLTLIAGDKISPFLDWLEQLVAESTGKGGKGIVPIIGERVRAPATYGNDRVFVRIVLADEQLFEQELKAVALAGHPVITIRIKDLYELGGQFYVWEYATAVACWLLGIHPFNQPDVESAKKFAREALNEYKKLGRSEEGPISVSDELALVYGDVHGTGTIGALANFLGKAAGGGYVGVQAYLPCSERMNGVLAGFRDFVAATSGLPVTLGYGPRFLHSTGQLHKGGPSGGLFIQLCATDAEDFEIPGEGITFGALKATQYLGDFQALKKSGREVARLSLKGDPAEALEKLVG